MSIRAIVNPRAGLDGEGALRALRGARHPDVEVCVTEGPGHARELAGDAARRGYDMVLAVGGDGTANETAWGLLGSETALGLVPVGSGNGLARALRIPLRAERALAGLERFERRRIDVGFANGRPFLNLAGAGFDAAVGADFHARGRNGGRRGILTYVKLSLSHALTHAPEEWRLKTDAEGFEGRAWIVAFLNGRQYGAGAVVAPQARLDDGRLEIVVFEATSRLSVLVNAPRLFLGGIRGFRGYRHFTASRAVLSGTGKVRHHRDGEPEEGSDRLEVRLEPRALSVLVPPTTAADPEGPFQPVAASPAY